MLPESVFSLLQRQHGALGIHQLRWLDPCERRRLLRSPDFRRLTPRVLVHNAAPRTLELEVEIAVLDAGTGAALYATSAADWFGFGRFRSRPVQVARPRTGARDWNSDVHMLRNFDPEVDTTRHRDVPVVRPEKTLLHLAGWFHQQYPRSPELVALRVAATIDHAWRLRLVDGPTIHRLVETSGGRGRAGIVAMRQALEIRPPDYQPCGSTLEERFEWIIGLSAAATFDRQVRFHDETLIGITDFGSTEWPLAVEINGEAWHTSFTDRQADLERYDRLNAVGVSVLVLWEHDIWHDHDAVRKAIRQLRSKPDEVAVVHRPTPAPFDL